MQLLSRMLASCSCAIFPNIPAQLYAYVGMSILSNIWGTPGPFPKALKPAYLSAHHLAFENMQRHPFFSHLTRTVVSSDTIYS